MDGPRRKRWRVALFAVGAVIAVVAAVAAGMWTYVNGRSVSTESIDGGALVSSDGRTVSALGASLCDWANMLLTAAEQPGRVVITLQYTRPRQGTCSGMPGFAVYHSRLQGPLGRRKLVDGVTGRPVPFFDSRRILRPGYLPPGYAFRYDAPDAYDLRPDSYLAAPEGPAMSCSQLYSRGAGNHDDLLLVTQAVGGRLEWPPRIRPRADRRARPPGTRDTRADQLDPGRPDDRGGHDRPGADRL